jgi:endoglucanase
MKGKTIPLLILLLLTLTSLHAVPPVTISKFIKIDQFGYLRFSKKVAVIVDPQTGYNAAESFSPGTGTNQYQVRRWADDAVVYTGTLVSWKSGITHTQSGDKGWWFDFSSVTTTGSYYIYDVLRNVGSYRFEINNNAYSEVLKQAVRMFFYQRINFAKQTPYVDAKWADAACFGGPNQDYAARSRWDKTNAATARDLHGGWMDAGDYNKYVTFALGPLCNMLEAYRMHKLYFGDNYNIPESGNGIPDILDEVKWEVDWLMRMQDASGTNGLFLKVGTDNFNSASPPSSDNNPRYYVPECTSSTLTGCAVFALAGTVYKSLGIPAMTTYGNDLITRAVNAWARAKVATSNFNIFQTTCDDQNIKSGDADQGIAAQKDMVVTAAAYLFEATGTGEYRNCFDTMYLKSQPCTLSWWGPYYSAVQKALLRYTVLPGATVAVVNNIRSRKAGQNGVLSITDYNNQTDLYRSYLPDAQYHWGSHEVKSNAGNDNLDFVTFSINPSQTSLYQEVAESYIHWFHGVNPMGKVMLSNMYAYGGDSCVNEFYHSWFANGTVWDNVFTSLYGPPPGYITGGPNKDFSITTISPPAGQPPQKSYKEWNTGWNGVANENSWEITEPAIYYQAAYISLLARVIGNNLSGIPLPLHRIDISATRNNNETSISWKTEQNDESKEFDLQRSTDGIHFITIRTVMAEPGKNNYSEEDHSSEAQHATVYYRIKEIDQTNRESYSPVVRLSSTWNNVVSVYPNPAKNIIVISGHTVNGRLTVQIFDAAGKLVLKESWQLPVGNYSKTIRIEELKAGVYWLRVSGIQSDHRVKIVKE